MRIIVMVLFFLVGSAIGAFANNQKAPVHRDQISGRKLLHFCNGKTDIDYGYCAGYLTSMAELMLDHKLYRIQACNHAGVKSQQLVELFRLYAGSNNDLLDYPATMIVAKMLSSSFPCNR